MALMKTLILALCIGHSAVLELPPRRRARLFSYMWCWVLLGHYPSLRKPKGSSFASLEGSRRRSCLTRRFAAVYHCKHQHKCERLRHVDAVTVKPGAQHQRGSLGLRALMTKACWRPYKKPWGTDQLNAAAALQIEKTGTIVPDARLEEHKC